MKPLASLSLDLDNKWSYLKTHGDRGWESYPSYLDGVVPRFVELLSDVGLKITVFVVGQDAAIRSNHEALSSLTAAGHGIGNHSFHHEPWLHLYSPQEIEDEISSAEEAIFSATGATPVGFRGPGYSLSPAVLACLARRGYRYDASTLPTLIGPLARCYYFARARLSADQRRQRQQLFGGWTECLRPLRPYWWSIASGEDKERRILELPVTTMPLLRVPIHFSYVLFLLEKSRAAAWSYWRLAMQTCRVAGVEPSLLLHPLDVIGGDEEPDLGFFPAMKLSGALKRDFMRELLADFSRCFNVLPLDEYAGVVAARTNLKTVAVSAEPVARSADQVSIAPRPEHRPSRLPVETIQQ
jgi:peptidoglycan/xylan/chitin deacetylase (PgdA/CDA1 family)